MERAFVMLAELLQQEQFELLLPEDDGTESSEDGDIRLVYLMNDAVESFLVFKEAKMTGKYLKDYDSLLAMGVLFATPVPAVIYGKIKRGMLGTLAIAVIFALSMYYLAVSANNPFLYFNF